MDLSKKIKVRASKIGLTLEEVEKAAGLSPRTIRRWDDHLPSFDKVYRVANVLGCTVDDLIRDDAEPTEPIFRSVAQ